MKGFFAALAIALLTFAAIAEANIEIYHSGGAYLCKSYISPAIQEVPRQTAHPDPGKVFDAFLAGANDVLCNHTDIDGKPAHMANILVIAVTGPKEYHYAAFHIHFNMDGSYKGAATLIPWTPTDSLDDPKISEDWCSFLSIYPEDFEAQCQ